MSNLETRLQESWKVNASAWKTAVRTGQIESRVLATDNAIVSAVLERAPHRVLDVGCGEGWLSARLAAEEIDVLGFDSSAELIEHAGQRGGAAYRVLDYSAFAANPAALGRDFDVAICNFSLLGKEIGGVIRGCAAVLKPGGAVLVQTIHPFADIGDGRYEAGWREEDFKSMGPEFAARMPWYFRTVGEWIAELVRNGLTIAEVREPIHPNTGKPLSLLLIATTTAP